MKDFNRGESSKDIKLIGKLIDDKENRSANKKQSVDYFQRNIERMHKLQEDAKLMRSEIAAEEI
jgi:hypothetical protein